MKNPSKIRYSNYLGQQWYSKAKKTPGDSLTPSPGRGRVEAKHLILGY
jgi:hypothetical protein